MLSSLECAWDHTAQAPVLLHNRGQAPPYGPPIRQAARLAVILTLLRGLGPSHQGRSDRNSRTRVANASSVSAASSARAADYYSHGENVHYSYTIASVCRPFSELVDRVSTVFGGSLAERTLGLEHRKFGPFMIYNLDPWKRHKSRSCSRTYAS